MPDASPRSMKVAIKSGSFFYPGVFQQFFEEFSSSNNGLPSPDLARTERLMQSDGIELLGPPLS